MILPRLKVGDPQPTREPNPQIRKIHSGIYFSTTASVEKHKAKARARTKVKAIIFF